RGLARLRGLALGDELRAHVAVHGSPDRVAVLGRGEREVGIDLEGLAELLTAEELAPRDAIRERKVLAGARLLDLGEQPVIERREQALHRVLVIARVVALHAVREPGRRALPQHRFRDLGRGGLRGLRGLGHHLRATRGDEKERGDRDPEAGVLHWNRCLSVISSRALRSTFSACAGNVVLRNSILYFPASSLMNFFGGDTPCDLPFTKISPQGLMSRNTVAGGRPPLVSPFALSPLADSALASAAALSFAAFSPSFFTSFAASLEGSAGGAGAGITAGEGVGS